jgi:hypothetical protein
MPLRWGLSSRRGALDKAFFGRRLLRIAWLSVLSVGAEVWNVLAVNANAVDGEQHSWDNGDATGETKGVRDRAGRARTLKSENMTVLYCMPGSTRSGKECRREKPDWGVLTDLFGK